MNAQETPDAVREGLSWRLERIIDDGGPLTLSDKAVLREALAALESRAGDAFDMPEYAPDDISHLEGLASYLDGVAGDKGRAGLPASKSLFEEIAKRLREYDVIRNRSRAGDAGEEIENGYTADDAVDFVFNRLASKLGLVDWQVVEGSEEWEGDVSATLHRLLIDAGIIDDETGAVATLATPAPAVDADEGYNPEAKPDRVNITPEHNEALHGALLASSAAVDAVPAGEVLKQQAHEWRRGEVQAIGAAISTRSWHAVEQAYNALRDKMDAAGCWHASAALSHGEADRG